MTFPMFIAVVWQPSLRVTPEAEISKKHVVVYMFVDDFAPTWMIVIVYMFVIYRENKIVPFASYL